MRNHMTYVCSGTVGNDGTFCGNKSVILSAAHCVYDDLAKEFATMVPNQAATMPVVRIMNVPMIRMDVGKYILFTVPSFGTIWLDS